MNRALIYSLAGLAAILIVGLAALAPGSGANQSTDGLDEAMQTYMNAILTGDKSAFLNCFSRSSNWRFISYRAKTHATVRNTSMNYEETAKEMAREGGLWSAFFGGTDAYRYRDRIADHPLRVWTKDETHSFTIPRSEGVISFVRWARDEDSGRWVIKIIGDDSP
ncbi:hypothetical protein SAMN05444156_1350 [Verrucomicrobium sp. GAS474]|uniref:hypothetical protein n=1 Tax=Verrucomicrobium sp. GAS474 TaxID=1882831 RepID=UPI000879F031|nr:hypothetical protein [Verrucomicrobium sp. GAS474]SDT99884.1 hypothetical protein SAMN05444156_1350 [Verrucomicrobium sp. GAS474]